MRAGASTVQQTLTPEAAAVLKHAVAEACRRGHAQATPLHVAAALLGAQGSPLRRACVQTHPHSSHPLQCRALELCFNVALDRLQAAQGPLPGGQPSYSNALVAALKRAQAHQRRGCPEQQQQPLLAVKVELEQLVISILDDPGVSRVMREAGFSSTDVKTHLEEMVDLMSSHHSLATSNNSDQARLSLGAAVDHVGLRLHASPAFLGNIALSHHMPQYNGLAFNKNDTQLHLRPPRTSFCMNPRPQTIGCMDFPSSGSEDVRRIVEVMLRRKNRNPVLVGESGHITEALIRDLMHRIDRRDVPEQLLGVKLITPQFFSLSPATATREDIEVKFSELNKVVEESMPGGAIIHVGDLQRLLENSPPKVSSGGALAFCPVQCAVIELGQILSRHGGSGRLWLIGTATCQAYLQCQVLHPCLEGRWQLQPVPITATPLGLGLQPRYKIREAMSNAIDASLALTAPHPAPIVPLKLSLLSEEGLEKLNCCSDCTAKYEQEFALLHEQERHVQSESPQSCATSLDTYGKEIDSERSSRFIHRVQPTLPLWLQKALPAHAATIDAETAQIKEKATSMTQKLLELRKKWNHTCQTLHVHQLSNRSNISSEQLQQLSPSSSQTSGDTSADRRANIQDIRNSTKLTNGYVSDYYHLGKHTGPVGALWLPQSCQPRSPTPYWRQSTHWNEAFDIDCPHDQPIPFLEGNLGKAWSMGPVPGSCVPVSDKYPPVKTDLSLGRTSAGILVSTSPSKLNESHLHSNGHKERMQDRSGCSPSWQSLTSMAPLTPSTSAGPPGFMNVRKQPNGLSTGISWQVDPEAFKRLCNGLAERVGWQKEIISDIANTVMQCRSGMGKRQGVSLKGDTWLLFLGSDRMGKIKLAQALAELIFGSEKKLISIRLGNQHTSMAPSLSNLGLQESEIQIGSLGRGKSPLDQLAEAVKLNPFSVVLLEDVDQSDSVMKNSLLRAMEKGRLCDSNGREVSFSNVIVVMTSSIGIECLASPNSKLHMQFTEERLAAVSGTGMRFMVGNVKCEKILLKSDPHLAIVNQDTTEERATQIELPSSASTSKRKVDWNVEDEPENKSLGSMNKKKNVEQAMSLDLNLSAEENEVVDSECCESACNDNAGEKCSAYKIINERVLHHAHKHMKDFCDLADATVVFHPFDFEGLRNTVIDILNGIFAKIPSGNLVEIDVKVLEHIMAAVWASNRKDTLSDWAAEVLDKSLSTVLSICTLSATSVVKLLSEQGAVNELRPSAVCLPTKIFVENSASAEGQ